MFCQYCGLRAVEIGESHWRCENHHETWLNPKPVVVVLQPILRNGCGRGLVAVRRAINPGIGNLVLPGGFVVSGETVQKAAARELGEETSIYVDPSSLEIFTFCNTPDKKTVLLFLLAPELAETDLPDFQQNSEASERKIIGPRDRLNWSLHHAAAAAWFSNELEGHSPLKPAT